MVMTCLLFGYSGASRAATVDDLKVCKHNYVMVADDYTNNGTGSRTKGGLFGDEYFLDVTGGSVAQNKGATDLSTVDSLGIDKAPLYVTQEIVDKYGEYGKHLNSLRLKNAQDVIAMKPTAGSKIIFFLQGNSKTGKDARYPKLSKSSDLSSPLNEAPTAAFTESTVAGFKLEYTVPNDWGTDDVLYMGSYNGDMFIGYIIVEVPVAKGTPTVMVGEQTYENGLWYREVTCKTVKADGDNTIVTYTTDGSTPDEKSPVYTEPIKCYANQTVKFQAYFDFDNGKANKDYICEGADNEANVNFSFDAPTIEANGAQVTITSPYEGAKNFVLINGDNEEETSSLTLEESATVTAYSKIINGDYAEFITKSISKDVYVLNPIKEKKTIKVIAGDVVFDDEYGYGVYRVEKGAISADNMDFFVKNLTFGVVDDADYQIDGKEIYIQMSNTNVTFQVAEGDSVNVKVVCSKNSCKNLYSDNATDRMCYVNVDGLTYCHMDADGNDAADQQIYPDANIIEFGLGSGYHTFQKYSGTGNIFIESIVITPVDNEQQAVEHNSLYIAEGLRLSTTKTNMLPISLKNEDEIVGFQFDVVLPQGMTLAKNARGKNLVSINSERTETHTLTANAVDDFTIRVIGTSMENEVLSGVDGILLEMGIDIASWVPNGVYPIQLKDVKLTNSDRQTLYCSDKTFMVTVGGKLGDVNCDDEIDVTDVVLIIDDILMKNPSNYDASLADVNSDGYIDVTDVVMVIDAILGKIELARGAEMIDRSAYTAFQMDLTIPAGYVLESVSLTDIAKDSHTLAYNMLADGRCRVVVCSMNNEALPGAWDEVISLNLRGKGNAQVNIDRAVFVTIDGERHELMMNPTSIAQISNLKSQASNLYDLQGRKVENISKGILIENGKKTIRK